MKKQFDIDIPVEKFEFAQMDEKIHDQSFDTKPIGYFMDAWLRFKKNKSSMIGLIIIIMIAMYAIVVPFVSNYDLSYSDGNYKKLKPKVEWLSFMDTFDGGYDQRINDKYLAYYMGLAIGAQDVNAEGMSYGDVKESIYNPIMELGNEEKVGNTVYRDARIDSYMAVGFKYMSVTADKYEEIVRWQQEMGIQVLYPLIDATNEYCAEKNNANFWYKTLKNVPIDNNDKKLSIEDIEKNGLADNYLRDDNGNLVFSTVSDKSMIQIRVLYYNYYQFENGFLPVHYLGTDGQGFDIFVRLAYGLRLSLLLATAVSVINLIFGSIWGAIEGYYGGIVDLVGERISDILSGIPFIVLATLITLHLVNTGKISQFTALILCYFLTGWISTAYRVRTQFYRFKNQEYVLAARTLGASDRRLILKHIFPNSLGTIITSSVLVVPSVIFTESVLSYLGIINFQGKEMTSLGTLLSNGQTYLNTDPHIILFPALMISLLMISFNLFGNGLRDAFNPSLRGAEE